MLDDAGAWLILFPDSVWPPTKSTAVCTIDYSGRYLYQTTVII